MSSTETSTELSGSSKKSEEEKEATDNSSVDETTPSNYERSTTNSKTDDASNEETTKAKASSGKTSEEDKADADNSSVDKASPSKYDKSSTNSMTNEASDEEETANARASSGKTYEEDKADVDNSSVDKTSPSKYDKSSTNSMTDEASNEEEAANARASSGKTSEEDKADKSSTNSKTDEASNEETTNARASSGTPSSTMSPQNEENESTGDNKSDESVSGETSTELERPVPVETASIICEGSLDKHGSCESATAGGSGSTQQGTDSLMEEGMIPTDADPRMTVSTGSEEMVSVRECSSMDDQEVLAKYISEPTQDSELENGSVGTKPRTPTPGRMETSPYAKKVSKIDNTDSQAPGTSELLDVEQVNSENANTEIDGTEQVGPKSFGEKLDFSVHESTKVGSTKQSVSELGSEYQSAAKSGSPVLQDTGSSRPASEEVNEGNNVNDGEGIPPPNPDLVFLNDSAELNIGAKGVTDGMHKHSECPNVSDMYRRCHENSSDDVDFYQHLIGILPVCGKNVKTTEINFSIKVNHRRKLGQAENPSTGTGSIEQPISGNYEVKFQSEIEEIDFSANETSGMEGINAIAGGSEDMYVDDPETKVETSYEDRGSSTGSLHSLKSTCESHLYVDDPETNVDTSHEDQHSSTGSFHSLRTTCESTDILSIVMKKRVNRESDSKSHDGNMYTASPCSMDTSTGEVAVTPSGPSTNTVTTDDANTHESSRTQDENMYTASPCSMDTSTGEVAVTPSGPSTYTHKSSRTQDENMYTASQCSMDISTDQPTTDTTTTESSKSPSNTDDGANSRTQNTSDASISVEPSSDENMDEEQSGFMDASKNPLHFLSTHKAKGEDSKSSTTYFTASSEPLRHMAVARGPPPTDDVVNPPTKNTETLKYWMQTKTKLTRTKTKRTDNE